MLRGAQTPGRAEDAHRAAAPLRRTWASSAATLERLIERDLAERLERRPGQREERYRQLLGEEAEDAEPPVTAPEPAREDRVERLEREVAALRAELEALRRALDS